MKKVPGYIYDLLDQLQYVFIINNYDRAVILAEKNVDKCAASIEIQEDYQRITITLYPSFFNVSRMTQREYLLHELCHTISNDLLECIDLLLDGKLVTSEQRRVASEKCVSRTANILDVLLMGRMRYAKKAYADFLKLPKRKKPRRKK